MRLFPKLKFLNMFGKEHCIGEVCLRCNFPGVFGLRQTQEHS